MKALKDQLCLVSIVAMIPRYLSLIKAWVSGTLANSKSWYKSDESRHWDRIWLTWLSLTVSMKPFMIKAITQLQVSNCQALTTLPSIVNSQKWHLSAVLTTEWVSFLHHPTWQARGNNIFSPSGNDQEHKNVTFNIYLNTSNTPQWIFCRVLDQVNTMNTILWLVHH